MESEQSLQSLKFNTQLATCRSTESSIVNQSGSDQDSPRDETLASFRSEPSQSPIESQQTDRRQVGFKAAIFDFDGVIVDSGPMHEVCWQEVAQGRHFSHERFLRGFGVKNERFIKEILEWTEDPNEIAEIIAQKERIFHAMLAKNGIPLIAGTVRLIRFLIEKRVPCAIGSSAVRENLDRVFAVHKGLSGFFSAIVSGEEVDGGKPDPEVFLKAAQKLQIEKEACVVFEDAPVGIQATHNAGMYSVALTTTFDETALQESDLCVHTLDEKRVRQLF